MDSRLTSGQDFNSSAGGGGTESPGIQSSAGKEAVELIEKGAKSVEVCLLVLNAS